jgi:hypothetical protein
VDTIKGQIRYISGGARLKYKIEIVLILTAIALFGLSAVFYSYSLAKPSELLSSGFNLYPYTGYAIVLVGFGSFFLVIASLSFSRRIKNLRDKSYKI